MDGYLLDLSHIDSFQKWAIVCAAALTVLYAVMRPLKKKKDPLAHPTNLSLAGQRAVEKQMTELLVELEQMARQMTAQLETRAVKLELLIKEADEKIATLRQVQGSNPRPARIDSIPGLPAAPDTRHAQVYELADQGRSARQIAQQLNRPQGEIELIIALRGHQSAELSCPS
jgi:DNA-binding NarL/FixJ family response regulator